MLSKLSGMRRAAMILGALLLGVLSLKPLGFARPELPVFEGESPPERVRAQVPDEENVLTVYLAAAPALMVGNGPGWVKARKQPDYVQKNAEGVRTLRLARLSGRKRFSAQLQYPHWAEGYGAYQGDWYGLSIRLFDLGQRALWQDFEDDGYEEVCAKAQDLGWLAGCSARHWLLGSDGLRLLARLANEPILAAEGLDKFPTSGLEPLLRTLNTIESELPPPSQSTLVFRDFALDRYRRSQNPSSEVERFIRSYYDIYWFHISRGEAAQAFATHRRLAQSWKEYEDDSWSRTLWPEEHIISEQFWANIFLVGPDVSAIYNGLLFNSLRFRIAAELYLREEGTYPEKWEQIVPGFLPSPLIDPFGKNRTLNFDGHRLWSVGWDEESQAGTKLTHDLGWTFGGANRKDLVLWTRPGSSP